MRMSENMEDNLKIGDKPIREVRVDLQELIDNVWNDLKKTHSTPIPTPTISEPKHLGETEKRKVTHHLGEQ
jgi:hypothetical protein